ncbi:MAG: pilus assembly protein [Chloroflexi bacterium]|nr:MAG: pilus assembly protein [Chloroflexota bacterium]TME17514.1 MAG: pilus assembly protein [Chloroflexota bacterium]TME19553.1 MAG: pilus assembly protein [Chloroflexota bacterium]
MRGRQHGQGLVEFALTFPVLFFVFVGMIDLYRIVEVNNAVAEAARQGARQAAANANPADNGFGAVDSNPCSGLVFTGSASGSGCLTDARIKATVQNVLGPFDRVTTLYSNTNAANCPNPAVIGTATVCVSPSQSASATAYADCTTARAALGHDPNPGELGGRQAEWTYPHYQGCFLVQVTVIYTYDAFTPLLGPFAPNFLRLASTSTMLAEY